MISLEGNASSGIWSFRIPKIESRRQLDKGRATARSEQLAATERPRAAIGPGTHMAGPEQLAKDIRRFCSLSANLYSVSIDRSAVSGYRATFTYRSM